MIIFTATLAPIVTVVVVLAGVATSSGSIHSLGGHFVLSGHQVSSLSAEKPFPSSIVVRIAGLLGFSMLLGACTWRLTSPRIAAGPDGIPARDHGAAPGPRPARRRTHPALASRHPEAWARSCTLLRQRSKHHDQVRLRCTDGRWPESRSLRNGGSLVSCIGWHGRRARR